MLDTSSDSFYSIYMTFFNNNLCILYLFPNFPSFSMCQLQSFYKAPAGEFLYASKQASAQLQYFSIWSKYILSRASKFIDKICYPVLKTYIFYYKVLVQLFFICSELRTTFRNNFFAKEKVIELLMLIILL